MGSLTFNGKSSDELGLIVQVIPSYEYPSNNISTEKIPGRNGVYIINENSYGNVSRSYSIAGIYGIEDQKSFMHMDETDFISAANKILNWLKSAKGRYARLEDTYEPLYFRKALWVSEGLLTDIYKRATSLNIDFSCMPERWLKSGEEYITVEETKTVDISNPTEYASKPLFEVDFSAGNNAKIYITSQDDDYESYEITITKNILSSATCYIDSEELMVYDKTSKSELWSNYVQIKTSSDTCEFPELKPGTTYSIRFEGNITQIKFKPRWWTL